MASLLTAVLALGLLTVLAGCGLGGQSKEVDKLINDANGHVAKGNKLDREVAGLFKQMGKDFSLVSSGNTKQAAAAVKKIEKGDVQLRAKLAQISEEAKASATAIATARELNVSDDMKTWLAMELEANGAWQKSTKAQTDLSKLFVTVAKTSYSLVAKANRSAGAFESVSGEDLDAAIDKAERELKSSTAAVNKQVERLTKAGASVQEASDNYERLKAAADAYFKDKSLGK